MVHCLSQMQIAYYVNACHTTPHHTQSRRTLMPHRDATQHPTQYELTLTWFAFGGTAMCVGRLQPTGLAGSLT